MKFIWWNLVTSYDYFPFFFAVTVFLNQNVSHYISFLTNKRCFCLSNLINLGPQTLETWLMTVTSDMTNSSPSILSCINALWKLIFFAMYCLLRLQLPNRSQLMQQYMNHKTHPEMMSSTLVKWCIHPLFLPAIITKSDG